MRHARTELSAVGGESRRWIERCRLFQAGPVVLIALVLLLVGCGPLGASRYTFDPEQALYPAFSGDNALAQVAAVSAFGPRPSGSAELETSRLWLEEQLAAQGWEVQRQTFDDKTPGGTLSFSNLRARHIGKESVEQRWKRPVQGLLMSHYDTKRYDGVTFVGANDPGSSVGALLEMARVLGGNPQLAQEIELVFFDGEEALVAFTATDGLYGSRHYGKELRKWPETVKPKWAVLMDLIGDQDLKIRVPSDSPQPLVEAFMKASEDLGHRSKMGIHPTAITDDHVPINAAGVPAIDIIDFDYPYWHTPGDTVDKISAESLEIVGQTVLLMVEKYLMEPE